MTHPTIPELGPVTDREYLVHIGVIAADVKDEAELADITPQHLQIDAHSLEPADIKAAIEKAGTNQAAIARYLGITTGHIAQVINKKVRSARVETELQKITGRPVYDVPAKKRGRTMGVWNGQVAA